MPEMSWLFQNKKATKVIQEKKNYYFQHNKAVKAI